VQGVVPTVGQATWREIRQGLKFPKDVLPSVDPLVIWDELRRTQFKYVGTDEEVKREIFAEIFRLLRQILGG
jgi:hypothetical protein